MFLRCDLFSSKSGIWPSFSGWYHPPKCNKPGDVFCVSLSVVEGKRYHSITYKTFVVIMMLVVTIAGHECLTGPKFHGNWHLTAVFCRC